MEAPPVVRRRGILALVTGRLPKYAYNAETLEETTRWMRRRKAGRPTGGAPPLVLEEYDPSLSDFTLFFLADSHNLNTIRFRPALVEFVQFHAKEECQCVCVPNDAEAGYLCHGTGFSCLPWEHENRAGILKLVGATQVPSVIVVQNSTGRRITDNGMRAIESNDARDVIVRWGRRESGLTMMQNVTTTCCVS